MHALRIALLGLLLVVVTGGGLLLMGRSEGGLCADLDTAVLRQVGEAPEVLDGEALAALERVADDGDERAAHLAAAIVSRVQAGRDPAGSVDGPDPDALRQLALHGNRTCQLDRPVYDCWEQSDAVGDDEAHPAARPEDVLPAEATSLLQVEVERSDDEVVYAYTDDVDMTLRSLVVRREGDRWVPGEHVRCT